MRARLQAERDEELDLVIRRFTLQQEQAVNEATRQTEALVLASEVECTRIVCCALCC